MAESVVTEHPEGEATRRDFIHIAAGAAAAGAGVMVVWPLVNSMNPAADTLALSTVEFDTSKVAEGMQIVITWQGKPVFVRNRTAAELQRVIADNDERLRALGLALGLENGLVVVVLGADEDVDVIFVLLGDAEERLLGACADMADNFGGNF